MDELNLNTVDAVQEDVVDSQVEENETNSEDVQSSESVNTEVAPVENKQVQSQEENAKFAEVRRKAAEEARVKAKDETITEMYGESHGIYTYAEYQAAIEKQKQEERDQNIREEYETKGLPEDVVSELVEWKKSREQSIAEKEAKQQQEHQQADMKDFISAFPDVKAEEIPTEVWQANANGIPLRYAYAEHALKLTRVAETKAKANEENAKSSMGSTLGLGGQGAVLTEEMVGNMSPQELSTRWKEVKKLYNMR